MTAQDFKQLADESVRGRLLTAAINLFDEKGFPSTTVREIVDAAGVTKPVLYYYFGSKEGIFLAIMQEALKVFLEELEKPYPAVTVRERIIAFSQRVHTLFRENVAVVRLVHATFYGPHHGAPAFDFEQFHLAFETRLQRLVAEGITQGELRGGDPSATMLAIMGAANVCMEIELAHPEKAIGAEGVARALKMVFDGVAVPGCGAGKE
jgi:TetR/AcrR family transcriptional regulator